MEKLELHPNYKNITYLCQDAAQPILDTLSTSSSSASSSSSSSSASSSSSSRSQEAKYDTILETMGLCSTGTPVEQLRNLGRMIKVNNPRQDPSSSKDDDDGDDDEKRDGGDDDQSEGRIYLLEHGQSHYRWLNYILNALAKAHANRHGCWWNRDIGAIVRESGLDVVRIKRYHLGTTWWIELRPFRAGGDGGGGGGGDGGNDSS